MNHQQWNGRKKKSFRPSRHALPVLLALASLALLVFGITGFAGYLRERNMAREASEKIRAVYYAAETESPAPGFTPETPAVRGAEAPVPSALPESAAEAPSVPPETAAQPGESAAAPLKAAEAPARGVDPGNPETEISARFRALQQKNKDIAGWITIGSMLDEPVVRRDNAYYMNHDAAGRPNANGAIFLDALIPLESGPQALILYGHNMRSGAMFGCLRNFEDGAFYRSYPFITFDSLYEEGRYVVFSVCRISVEEGARNSLDLYALNSADAGERLRAVETLKEQSVHPCAVDVREQDRLLILVTCVDRDDERRLVAARRLREGETETELHEQLRKGQ